MTPKEVCCRFRALPALSIGVLLFSLSAAVLADMPTAEAVASRDLLGDAVKGERSYKSRCTGCHSLDSNRVGPKHRGVYGRTAGAVVEFRYSQALRDSDVVWTDETLDRWLANPEALIPGQRMNYRLSDAEMRRDIIAYLKQESR